MTAARRLAAILAADTVGYSRLMGDVAGTARGGAERTICAAAVNMPEGRSAALIGVLRED